MMVRVWVTPRAIEKGWEKNNFVPRKAGDVGHDLECRIYPERMGWFSRLLTIIIGRPVIVLWPLVGQRIISTGVHLIMDGHTWCEIRARSSTSRRKIMVLGGTIDSGYWGELYVNLVNFGFLPRLVSDGDRLAQVVFFPALRPTVLQIETREHFEVEKDRMMDNLPGPPKIRHDTGFGSTG